MKILTPEERLSATYELLRSLYETIVRLRQRAELICDSLQNRDEREIGDIGKKVAAVEGLIRTCQKVEISLVEQELKRDGIAQGGYALDLEEARAEVGGRLDRLHAQKDKKSISE